MLLAGPQVIVPAAATSHGVSSNTTSTSSNVVRAERFTSPGCLSLHMAASLLQLRGDSPSTSPLQDSNGNILCFNGEIFAGLDIPAGGNDGKALLTALHHAAAAAEAPLATSPNSLSDQCTAEAAGSTAAEAAVPQAASPASSSNSITAVAAAGAGAAAEAEAAASVMGVLSKLRGPWSVIYWQEQQQRLWFGRDLLGKWTGRTPSSGWPSMV
jgi:hypothetical protein